MRKIYQQIAGRVGAIDNCIKTNNADWQAKHEAFIDDIMKKTAPSGSGIDCGTKFLDDESTSEKLVFLCEYHHMNNAGYYNGWTTHKIIVSASLQFGFSLSITGKDRNQIKEYLHDTYSVWLNSETE